MSDDDVPLQCHEVMLALTPVLLPPAHPPQPRHHQHQHNLANHNDGGYAESLPQFCATLRDPALVRDLRVVANLLRLEHHYLATTDHYAGQGELKLHMRKIVAEWMLDVCVDQRCHVNVFLLAANIMDRFLATISLQKKQFQLLGACAIFIASKMLEPTPIAATTLVKYTADTYDREELLSMELLILSQLKWDLMAITAYDYLDHLLEMLRSSLSAAMPQSANAAMPHSTLKLHLDSLRRSSERLITLCATEAAFLSLEPSKVVSASLTSAVQQDFESQPLAGPNVSLKHILGQIQAHTGIETDCLSQLVEQIERLFICGSSSAGASSPASLSSRQSTAEADSFYSSPDRLSWQEAQQQQQHAKAAASSQSSQSSQSDTPTEVFKVSALLAT